MGRRGPLAKPAERAQGHRRRANLAVVRAKPLDAPTPPEGLSEAVLAAWETYWRSEVAEAATDVDVPAIRRLFTMYEAHARATEVAMETLVVAGSKGQPRVNPLADYALRLEEKILRLENELGLTPLARMRLGIAVGQARMTLEEINERARSKAARARKDPRVAAS